jgi:hypothetical protein
MKLREILKQGKEKTHSIKVNQAKFAFAQKILQVPPSSIHLKMLNWIYKAMFDDTDLKFRTKIKSHHHFRCLSNLLSLCSPKTFLDLCLPSKHFMYLNFLVTPTNSD